MLDRPATEGAPPEREAPALPCPPLAAPLPPRELPPAFEDAPPLTPPAALLVAPLLPPVAPLPACPLTLLEALASDPLPPNDTVTPLELLGAAPPCTPTDVAALPPTQFIIPAAPPLAI